MRFGVSCQLQQLLGAKGRRVYFHDPEISFGQGSGLVKYNTVGIGQGFQVAAAFDQDTAFGGGADAAEEAERN